MKIICEIFGYKGNESILEYHLEKVILYDNIDLKDGVPPMYNVEFYCRQNGNHNNRFVLLSGFIKKTDKTPERELDRAGKYREDFERRCVE